MICRWLAMACSSAARACASALRRAVALAFELREVRLGLLEVEPVARARFTSSRFCSTRSRARSALAETSRTRDIAWSMALLAWVTWAAAPVELLLLLLRGADRVGELRFQRVDLQLVGRGIDA